MDNIKSQIEYEKVLPRGKDNAVSAAALAERLGFRTVRMLQKDIEKARGSGQIILSATTGGYYLPANDAEIEKFIATMRSRALMTLRAIKYVRRYLNETKGQMKMNLETERK